MTQRERLTSSGGTEAAPRHGSEDTSRPPDLWEQLFRTATPERQHELLTLARSQGVLYAHQLPAAPNGHRNGHNGTNHANGEHAAMPLAQILGGHAEGLEPLRPASVPVIDTELDEGQRDAVARALSTPDICLIQGLPGTGKSRVVAEIILQAAQRGERVLLLAHAPAALDRIFELVGEHETLCPIRCKSHDEKLTPISRSYTFEERLRSLRDAALQRAREELASAEAAAIDHARMADRLGALHELAERADDLERRRAALSDRQAGLAAEVEAEAGAADMDAAHGDGIASRLAHAAAVFREQTAAVNTRRAELTAAVELLNQRRAELSPRLDALRPAIENRRRGRWWTADWWRLLISARPAKEFDALEADDQKIQGELIGADAETQRLERDRANAQQAYQTLRDQVVSEELVRRRSGLAGEEAVLRHEHDTWNERWQATCDELGDACPSDRGAAALAHAAEMCRGRRAESERRLQTARDWLAYLEREADPLGARLVQYANLVVATTGGLAADEHFGSRSAAHFDCLIVQDAERVTRSELLALAPRAARCVLVGEPEFDVVSSMATAATLRSPAALQPSLFASLWQTLAPDGRRFPCTWIAEKDRLCCRLRPVTAEQRSHLETERLADRPDIELRILTSAQARPAVAEIVFPRTLTVAQAKEFIWRELEELSIAVANPLPLWCTVDGRVALAFGRNAPVSAAVVDLGHGVREVLEAPASNGNGGAHPASPWATSRIEFDGMDRDRAEEWVHKYLGFRDLGRVARLDVPHRMSADLAHAVADLLFAGEYCLTRHDGRGLKNGASAVEFVSAAKRPAADTNGHGRSAKKSPARTEGAGLELDLADRRHLDRLPTELRAVLPNDGIVNYFEAQAVVRALEGLAAQGIPTLAKTAVIALYPAQVELIRRLVAQCPGLAACGVTIDTPAAFHEREYAVVLVSLTRSHSHRAVTFGEGPRALATALTRARARMIVFGDPGTLARRSQWENAVDHLDGAAAARERAIVTRLLKFADSPGFSVRAVPATAGAGV